MSRLPPLTPETAVLAKGVIRARVREQIALTVAQLNRFGYCLSAHTAIGGLSDAEIVEVVAYEWHDDDRRWFRSYGNEQWEFDANGLMRRREASINDVPIDGSDRRFRWEGLRRPDDHPGLSELGL